MIEGRRVAGYPTAQPHVLTGHLSTSETLLANISYKTKSYLEWDSKAERFTNNAAANQMLNYKYRDPYKLP